MRRFASLAGVSLIAGGLTALLLFASSARATPKLDLGSVLPGNSISPAQDPGSGDSTTTSSSSTTSTTTGGSGSGASTTSSSTSSTSSTSSSSTSSSSTTSTTRGGPTITTNVQSVQAGGTVQVTGARWPANTDVSLVLTSDPVNLGTVRSDANGAFSVVVTIPSNTTAGNHTLTASGGGQSVSMTLVVSGKLVVTGISWNLAILGLALLAAGIIVLAGDRIGRQELIEFS